MNAPFQKVELTSWQWNLVVQAIWMRIAALDGREAIFAEQSDLQGIATRVMEQLAQQPQP